MAQPNWPIQLLKRTTMSSYKNGGVFFVRGTKSKVLVKRIQIIRVFTSFKIVILKSPL